MPETAGSAGLLNGWSRGDILTLIGVVVAIIGVVVAIVPPFRHFARRLWRVLLMRAGFPRRRYARWFVKEWGVYDNPYLDAAEHLDLRNTYVPLSFRSGDEPQETMAVATEVLAAADAANLIIYGGPGSGKSTLLKAYGVGALQGQVSWGGGPPVVPFFVQLRKFARFLGDGQGLADYIVEKILVAEAGMSRPRAREFLAYSLRKGQVVVMLDGLDEVMSELYEPVRLAVFDFTGDHNPDRPTHLARMLLTCRRQNFLSLRDDWVPAFSRRECSLAPLRNSEIFSYLDKTRRLFKTPDGPENFMQAVRASGTLDLHRIPLILAMSVGLYSRRDFYEIPSSIAELYRMMIREMLDRHSFRRDPGGRALRFQVGDKYRFLREFSLYVAEESGAFDDFGKGDLTEFATSLAPQLDAVRDPRGLVDEIIQRSGLLTDVGEGKTYVFAHRSIQEYLVAEQLRTRNDGDDFLLIRAEDQEWRQVVQFYTAGQEQRQIDGFLKELSTRNAELAAYCLAGAKASDGVASAVLDALEPIDAVRLSALGAATMSPRVSVQEMAIERLKAVLTRQEQPLYVHYDVEGLLPLLNSIAATNAAEIAALVPRFMDLSADPRLVEPLWRCLAVPGIEQLPACGEIVSFLLRLVVDPNSLDELARQDRYNREFLTGEIRRRAYPFNAGLDQGHNLVTLLSWAEYLNLTPPPDNRFLAAKTAGRLERLEADRRRTISFSPCWPARIISGTEFIGAITFQLLLILMPALRSLRPYNASNYWLELAGTAVTGIVFTIASVMLKTGEHDGNFIYWITLKSDPKAPPRGWFTRFMAWVAMTFCAVAAIPLAAESLVYFGITVIAIQGVFFATGLSYFSSGRRYYLYRPNEFVDAYDDPRSRPWLGLAGPSLQLGDELPGGGGPA
jgi:hypothetical protein